MIDFVKGLLAEKEIARVVVEAHGVGYEMNIPLSTYEKLPGPGAELKLHTHYHVREDAHRLFGFFTTQERELFRQLINVNMIGPKVALSILSGISATELVRSVNTADTSRLEKIPGVGAKTAQRILVELRGKLSYSPGMSATAAVSSSTAAPGSVRDEVFAAMLSLGYNDKQITRALSRVEQTVTAETPIEEWIRNALQVI
jgi:holliday junction DNA helicase RuvA